MKTLFFAFFFLTISPLLSSAQEMKVNTDQAKLRKCDGRNCATIGRLALGEIVEIVSVGKTENIDGYGKHPWIKVKPKGKRVTGYVFGALLDLQNTATSEIKVDSTAYVRADNLNVRACGGSTDCDVLFRLKKGVFCRVISKTKTKEKINGLGENHWYFIEANQKKGYVFGGLVAFENDDIQIDSSKVKVYDKPNGSLISYVGKGDKYKILAQSEKSEVIRPYGRNYWYKIDDKGEALGWVYGVYTSKKEAPVDCQCVDYVKNLLALTGPTKNAFEWDEVLQGLIPVTENGKEVFLDYEEILDPQKVKKGDIAVFDKLHAQVDDDYGHLGVVHAKIYKDTKNGKFYVPVIGANHKVPLKRFFTGNNCNNLSYIKYRLNDDVRFFRVKSSSY